MSEAPGPDVLAGLATVAAELGEIRQRLAELDKTVHGLGGQVKGLTSVAAEVRELAEAVAELSAAAPGSPPRPVDWHHLAAEERAEELGQLMLWVRDVLFVGWPSARRDIRHCWPRHLEIVNALLSLRTAWQTAYDHPDGRAHHAAEFHRWLYEVRTRAQQLTRGCPRPGETEPPHPVPLPHRDDGAALGQAQRDGALGLVHVLSAQARHQNTPPAQRAAARAEAERIWTAWQISDNEYAAYERALKLAEEEEREAAYTRDTDEQPAQP